MVPYIKVAMAKPLHVDPRSTLGAILIVYFEGGVFSSGQRRCADLYKLVFDSSQTVPTFYINALATAAIHSR